MIDWKKIRSYGSKLTGEERERYDRFVDNLAWSVEHFEDEADPLVREIAGLLPLLDHQQLKLVMDFIKDLPK